MKMLLLLLLAANPNPDLDRQFDRDVLIVIASGPACHRLDVYLAETFEQRRQGLMFVRNLPDMSGMLFLYNRPEMLSMWMRNTLISLDIAFVAADGNIINIARNTEPKSERSISAAGPSQYVLELNAGAAERLGLAEGSVLLVDDLIALRSAAR
jgi:uncharacterized membrane protein (UPF0127 family)